MRIKWDLIVFVAWGVTRSVIKHEVVNRTPNYSKDSYQGGKTNHYNENSVRFLRLFGLNGGPPSVINHTITT